MTLFRFALWVLNDPLGYGRYSYCHLRLCDPNDIYNFTYIDLHPIGAIRTGHPPFENAVHNIYMGSNSDFSDLNLFWGQIP